MSPPHLSSFRCHKNFPLYCHSYFYPMMSLDLLWSTVQQQSRQSRNCEPTNPSRPSFSDFANANPQNTHQIFPLMGQSHGTLFTNLIVMHVIASIKIDSKSKAILFSDRTAASQSTASDFDACHFIMSANASSHHLCNATRPVSPENSPKVHVSNYRNCILRVYSTPQSIEWIRWLGKASVCSSSF